MPTARDFTCPIRIPNAIHYHGSNPAARLLPFQYTIGVILFPGNTRNITIAIFVHTYFVPTMLPSSSLTARQW